MKTKNNLSFTSGKELHTYLNDNFKKFEIDFEDAELNDDSDMWLIQPINFQKAINDKYLSIDNKYGQECYNYNLV